jgi:hypothetical protein
MVRTSACSSGEKALITELSQKMRTFRGVNHEKVA